MARFLFVSVQLCTGRFGKSATVVRMGDRRIFVNRMKFLFVDFGRRLADSVCA